MADLTRLLEEEEQRRNVALGLPPSGPTLPQAIWSGLKWAGRGLGNILSETVDPFVASKIQDLDPTFLAVQEQMAREREAKKPSAKATTLPPETTAEPPTQPVPVEPRPSPSAKPSPTKVTQKVTAKKEGTTKAVEQPAATPVTTTEPTPTQAVVTPFPEMKYTPRIDAERELTGILDAMPRTIEDLGAGTRPQVRRPETGLEKLLAILLLTPAAGAAGGWDPYWERKQAVAERPWKEEIEYQKKRQEVIREYKLKAFDAKLKQNEEQRELERKQYAALGERNPALAQNPGYVVGLYPDLPPDVVAKLKQQSIDPTTGNFKPGAILYLSPTERWKLKREAMAGVLKDLGITDPKQQTMFIENPDKYWDIVAKQYDSIEKQIVFLRSQPPTPENAKKIEQLISDKNRLDASAKGLEDHQKMGLMNKALDEQEAIQKERALQRYASNLRIYTSLYGEENGKARADTELQSDVRYIQKQYADYRDLYMKYTTGKTLTAYRTGATKENIMETVSPDMKVFIRIFPTLYPELATKGEIPKKYDELSVIAHKASNVLTGKVKASVYRNKIQDPYEQMDFDKMWEGMIGMMDSSVIQAAIKKYGSVELIPFKLLFQAAQAVVSGSPDLASQLLLGAK